MSNKKLLLASFGSGLILILITEPILSILHQGYFNNLEPDLLEPLFFTTVSYFTSSIILLFFSEKIFKLWLRKIISWFLPLSVFLIWAAGSGSSIINPSRTDYAVAIGCALAFITLIFALVQKFYYKR